MRAIIGLGNPGSQYTHTRHNVGFDVISILADKTDISLKKLKCRAIIGEGQIDGEKAILVLPQTFMNNSGLCVTEILHYFKLDPADTLIIHDDIDLPLGKVRVRPFGGAGTHNGMRSIVSVCMSDRFPRIRVGVGGKPAGWDLADWVLSRYETAQEKETAFQAYVKAADAAKFFVANGIELTMNRFNQTKTDTEKPEGQIS